LRKRASQCSGAVASARPHRGIVRGARRSRRVDPISYSEYTALATSWHDFYLTAGAASATLIGLLFVGLSINLDEFTSESGVDLRLLAEQAFANFLFVLLIALFVLVPNQDAISFTVELGILGVAGVLRMIRRVRAFRRRRDDPFGGWVYVARRLGLPGAASLGLIAVGIFMLRNPFSAYYWLIGAVLIYLMSAADTTWDLLIEVGRQRHRAG
jgi:hypothetical protein